jgi:hypothetical protein
LDRDRASSTVEEFTKIKREIGGPLEAIKNVGNEGTHRSGTQSRANVLRLVVIIETVIEMPLLRFSLRQ